VDLALELKSAVSVGVLFLFERDGVNLCTPECLGPTKTDVHCGTLFNTVSDRSLNGIQLVDDCGYHLQIETVFKPQQP
jgi:hypothetical protein